MPRDAAAAPLALRAFSTPKPKGFEILEQEASGERVAPFRRVPTRADQAQTWSWVLPTPAEKLQASRPHKGVAAAAALSGMARIAGVAGGCACSACRAGMVRMQQGEGPQRHAVAGVACVRVVAGCAC